MPAVPRDNYCVWSRRYSNQWLWRGSHKTNDKALKQAAILIEEGLEVRIKNVPQ